MIIAILVTALSVVTLVWLVLFNLIGIGTALPGILAFSILGLIFHGVYKDLYKYREIVLAQKDVSIHNLITNKEEE